jgi:spermidine/putrescine transport system substrate-binding protein
MKRFIFIISIAFILILSFTSCGNVTSAKAHTSIDAVAKYLSTATGGASVDNPIPLSVKIDLQNMLAADSGWKKLLAAINTAGKYVSLDLSACIMPGTEFNPDSGFADGKKFITYLTLPDTAKSLPDRTNTGSAYQHFVSLSSVPIGKGITSVGDTAFSWVQLDSIIIPDSITSVGDAAFYGCGLTDVIIPNGVTTIGSSAFAENKLASIIIPDGVTTIYSGAFMENQLTSVTFPDSLTFIGAFAFSDNYRLTSVTFPDSVTSIGSRAFSVDDFSGGFGLMLTSITIGADVALDNSFGLGFETAYNFGGRQAGTYTRPNYTSRTWTRQPIASARTSQPATGAVSTENRETLSIYTWNYYTPASVIQKFEREYGVQVVVAEYASNEEMYTKLAVGNSGYDLVFPSQDYVSIMIRQSMLKKLDKSLIGNNIGNIDPTVLEKAIYDSAMDYSVPFYWGAVGIIVNNSRIPTFERSWSIFSRSDLRNRMTMLDDMRRLIGSALASLGYSVNSKNLTEIEAATNLINTQWKPNLTMFDSERFGKGYANGEHWIVQGRAEVVYREIADNAQLLRNTVFFIPQNSPAYIDSMCIPKGAKNKELAYKFIDYIHRPEIYAELCDALGLPATVNVPARQYIEGPSLYEIEALAGKELLYDIGDALDLYNNAWFSFIRGR